MNPDSTRTPQETTSCPACGLSVSAAAERCPRDGTYLIPALSHQKQFAGKYEFMGLIGSGGMGIIYKAKQVGLNKIVAIKVMHQHISTPESLKRFSLEARTTASLSHKHIVTVHDFDITDSGIPFLVMDYIDGRTLSSILSQECQLTQARFLHLFMQICDAIGHAHKRGILHRDLKPSNIMIVHDATGSEQIRIMDFGLAKIMADQDSGVRGLTGTGEMVGSPIYMSPEQAQTQKLDERSDLYSLGVMMYEALTGTPPFIGSSPVETLLMHVHNAPVPLKEASLGTPINYKLERLVMKLLNKDPASRYQTAEAVAEDLQILETTQSQPAVQAMSDARDLERSNQKQKNADRANTNVTKIVALVALTIGIIGCGAAYFLTHGANNDKSKSGENIPSSTSQTAVGNGADPSVAEHMPSETSAVETEQTHGKAIDYIKDKIEETLANRDSDTVDLSQFAGKELADRYLDQLTQQRVKVFVKTMILDGLIVQDNQLHRLANLDLITLSLSHTPVRDLSGLAGGSLSKTLQHLLLCDTKIDEASIGSITKLPNLKVLEIAGTNWQSYSDLSKLAALPNLKKLDIRDCTFASGSPSSLKESLPHCEFITGQRTALHRRSNQAALYKAQAITLQANQRWKEAAAAWENYLSSVPEKDENEEIAECYSKQGDCWLNDMDDFKATAKYEKAAKILEKHAPHSYLLPDMYQHLASLASKTGEYDDAIKLQKMAVTIVRKYSKQDKAEAAYSLMRRLSYLAGTCENAHRQKDADQCYKEVADLFSENWRQMHRDDNRNDVLYEARKLAVQANRELKNYAEAKKLALENIAGGPPEERNSNEAAFDDIRRAAGEIK